MPGGGGGSIASMILALKNNALLLRKRKSLKDINGRYPGRSTRTELEFPDATPEELKAFHEQVLRQKRRSTFIQVTLALLFLAVAVILVILIVGFMG